MKLCNFFSYAISIFIIGGFLSSCSDFLDEVLTTRPNTDYFDTEQGVEELSVALYYNLRFHFSKEWAYATTNYGTDEFTVGGDGSNKVWNDYSGGFSSQIVAANSNTVMAETLWNEMYIGINNANLLLNKIKSGIYNGENVKIYTGEAYFLRGFNYLKLVSQYGGVPLKLTSTLTSPEREFTRATAEATLAQVISDLTNAYNNLPEKASMTGKITKDAAAHFLAKAYLLRASEINDDWNSGTKEKDLNEALRLAQEVISHHSLAPNYSDLWNYTEPNGANELLDEILLSAQFSSDKSTLGAYGNPCHLYFLSVYNNLPQMQRDIAGGREYQRLRTTYYMYNIYDMINDSRFWKSFKTKYAVNNPKDNAYQKGDLGVMYVINRPGDNRFSAVQLSDEVIYAKTGKTIPTVFIAYPEDRNGRDDIALYDDVTRFAPLSKYMDGSREAVSDMPGYRDGILARLGETYLIAAEVLIRQGEYQQALKYINDLRARAAYKEGEDRSAYCDGGAAYNENSLGYTTMGNINSYFPENSYYESNNIPVTTAATSLEIKDYHHLPEEDEAVIEKLGYTSDYDRMMCLLLNERSRELCGEFYRWEDLSRTKTLVERAKAFNPEAAPNIQEHHNLRPIPQTYLDALQKDGHALTAEEKKAQQNPGY